MKSLVLIILPLSFLLFFFRLGDRSFRNPDEGRYAEISREMTLSGNWVEPRLYGLDYLRKPPLFYWLVAASFKTFGSGEWQARLVPALFGIFGVVLTFFFALRTFSVRTAIFSSLVLLSNFWYVQVGRYLVIDMVFSFFVTAAIFFFYLGHTKTWSKKAYYLLFFLSMAVAFLAKGLLGFVIPGFVIFFYLLFTKKLRQTVAEMGVPAGLGVMAVLTGAWLVPVSLKEPRFWDVFFLREHVQRLVSKNFEHQAPWYFYPVLMFLFCLPWSLFVEPLKAGGRLMRTTASRNEMRFPVLVVVLTVFLLSLSRSKLATYILPTLPFTALAIGHCWAVWCGEKNTCGGRSLWVVVPFVLFLVVLAGGFFVLPLIGPLKEFPGMVLYLKTLWGVVTAGSLVVFFLWRQKARREWVFYSLAATMMAGSILFVFAVESANAGYTNKSFAETLSPYLKPDDAVYLYDHPGPFYDFAFYLGHSVKLVGLEGEFEGMVPDEKTSRASVTRDDFQAMMRRGERFFCLIRKSDFESLGAPPAAKLRVLKEDGRKVLFEAGAV